MTDFSEKTHVSFESRFKLHLKNPGWGGRFFAPSHRKIELKQKFRYFCLLSTYSSFSSTRLIFLKKLMYRLKVGLSYISKTQVEGVDLLLHHIENLS